MNKVYTLIIAFFTVVGLSGCNFDNNSGSQLQVWCDSMENKPKSEWSDFDVKEYPKRCTG